MHLIKPNSAKPAPPEEVFAAKYEWLLGWALQFAEGDRATAEDLVQDTFVRFMVAQPEIKDPENAEPLLYTYLKYVHLAHQRRVRRQLQHHLTIVDFDSIRLAVRDTPGSDPVDVQDDLRRVTAYLAWRKETAKCASILILRFLHGYIREEIMKVALVSAQAVSNGLLLARDETKSYLEDATSLRVMHHPAPPEPLPREVAVPLDQLLQELRNMIFNSCQNPCLPKDELLQYYARLNPTPIDSGLLAHIVSCERCLDLVNDSYGIPRLDRRSPGQAEGSSRRSKSSSRRRGGGGSDARLVLSGAKDRLRELYDHRPQSLSLAVNGHVLAARDISSAVNRLEIEVRDDTRVDFIEVFSEQGFCLLSIPVESAPPRVGPQLRHEASLGDMCKLELFLKFTSNRLLIEAVYRDESLLLERQTADRDAQDMIPLRTVPGGSPAIFPTSKQSRRTRLWRRLKHIFVPDLNPLFASAMALALASVVCFFLWWGNRTPMNSHDFLVQAERWDNGIPGSDRAGVVYQKVSIRTPKQTIERPIYRDAKGKRHPKPQFLSPGLNQLREQLATAGVPWDEPLSAGSYQVWHDHQQVQRDRVSRSGKNLLTLTTTVASGTIAQESLTIREIDFHPVARTVQFRDSETVEIAELNYDVMPWGAMNEEIFEPLADVVSDSSRGLHPSLLPRLPHVLSDMEIDEAELEVRLVLNELGADKGERIDLVRTPGGVQIKGIVATTERKDEIESHLRFIAHAVPAIYTFEELAGRARGDADITSIQQSSVTAGETPLEKYLLSHGKQREDARRISVQLFNDAASITQNGKAAGNLIRRFEENRQLTTEAQRALDQLLARHKDGMLAALNDEDRLVAEIGIPVPKKSGLYSPVSVSLKNAAEENIQLCKELISADSNSTRPAEEIVPDLFLSVHRLRSAVQQATSDSRTQ